MAHAERVVWRIISKSHGWREEGVSDGIKQTTQLIMESQEMVKTLLDRAGETDPPADFEFTFNIDGL